jgi:hypothetical protein
MASDVFSLGATLLFAAAGHPPYQGETVMDVLVRLATEPPDLTGLPPELTPIVTACLERSPRNRPTSTAILAELAPFVGATPAPGSGHSYLPAGALTLIGEYERSPQAPPGPGPGHDQDAPSLTDDASEDVSEDATFGSYTALPAAQRSRWGSRRGGGRGPERRGAPPGASPGGRSRPRILAGAILAAGAVVLVAAGAALGASLAGTPGAPTGSGKAAATATTYPTLPPPPPDPGPPPSSLPSGTSARPKLVMGQRYGDGFTAFVVHGSGFVPLTTVGVDLVGHGTASFRPTADQQGTFNYAIDQDHVFFAGPMPVGTYHVLVTGKKGRRATASFEVLPQPRPAASGAPPSGQGSPSPPGAGRPSSSAGARLTGRGGSVHGA